MRIEDLRTRAVSALVLLAVMTVAPFVLAQQPKKPKKKAPAPAAVAPAPEPTPPPAPEPTPPPAPEPPPPAVAPVVTEAPKEAVDENANDPTEKVGEKYTFIGLRYRATVIPKFVINLFADEGSTVISHEIGIEYEIRRDGFSLIPWASFATYGMDDTLFHQKNQPTTEGFYSVVNSSLKALYGGADLLWSTEISNKVAIEYGGGAGLGYVFGDLGNSWVRADTNGALVASDGKHYSPCVGVPTAGATDKSGCDPSSHTAGQNVKVNGYTEPSWFSGGSRPAIFPHFSLPQVGVRFKPVKQFAARAVVGFSITGFFFGLSGSYGLPVKSEPKGPTSNPPLANSSEEHTPDAP